MILYIVGIAVALGFAALLWRQHKSGAGWQREVSFFLDLMALGATALMVGVLAMVQLGAGDAAAPASPTEVAAVRPSATARATSTRATRATRTPRSTATPAAEGSPEATAEASPSVTVTLTITATVELTATATLTPTAEATPTPEATPEPTATPATTTYAVQEGDTLIAIAQRFGVTVEAIQAANPGVTPEGLQIGQLLVIPRSDGAPTAPPPPTVAVRTYTIQQGDTLGAIAQRFGVTTDQLLAANPGLNPNRLSIGQVIRIP